MFGGAFSSRRDVYGWCELGLGGVRYIAVCLGLGDGSGLGNCWGHSSGLVAAFSGEAAFAHTRAVGIPLSRDIDGSDDIAVNC